MGRRRARGTGEGSAVVVELVRNPPLKRSLGRGIFWCQGRCLCFWRNGVAAAGGVRKHETCGEDDGLATGSSKWR